MDSGMYRTRSDRQTDMDSRVARMIQEQRVTLMMHYQRRNDPTIVTNIEEAFQRYENETSHEALDPQFMLQRYGQEGYDSAENASTDEYDSLDLDDMTYEDLRALEETQYAITRKSAVDEKELCTVCRDEFEEKQAVKVLPCGHVFHPDCIDQWLRLKKKCPICSKEVKLTP